MRRAVNEIGAEFEVKTSEELIRLVDNPDGAYEFERQFEGLHLHFVLEEMESGNKQGWCIDVSGLPTILGICPGYHFFKDQQGSVSY